MDLKLDDNNDLVIENNDLSLVESTDFIKQFLKQKLQTFLGEWFLDTSIGVPYFQDILKKQAEVDTISSILKDEILDTPGVIELEEFVLDFTESSRELSLNFSVRTTDGIVIVNIEELI